MVDLLTPLLSAETVTILQLLGFNFRRAIGEPLTELVASLISTRTPADSDRLLELQALQSQRDIKYIELASDPESFARLKNLNT
jgi:hypothetical protein